MSGATLHLMVGLPCSGKTTYAKKLASQVRALLLSPDPWQLTLFGDDQGSPLHDERHDLIERLLWGQAEQALSAGISVILDFGFWSRAEREDFRRRAASLGADLRIHFMDVPFKQLLLRARERNAGASGGAFFIREEDLRHWAALFEPPGPQECAEESKLGGPYV